MKDFKHYLAEGARNYAFVIKFAEPPTEEQVQIIEAWLKRYELREASKPMVIEDDHKDFIDVPNKQVHSMRVVLGAPVSPYVLLQDLKIAANISEKFMVVRNENEPIERYAEYDRSEEHTSELQSRSDIVCGAHRDLHSFPTRRSSDLCYCRI